MHCRRAYTGPPMIMNKGHEVGLYQESPGAAFLCFGCAVAPTKRRRSSRGEAVDRRWSTGQCRSGRRPWWCSPPSSPPRCNRAEQPPAPPRHGYRPRSPGRREQSKKPGTKQHLPPHRVGHGLAQGLGAQHRRTQHLHQGWVPGSGHDAQRRHLERTSLRRSSHRRRARRLPGVVGARGNGRLTRRSDGPAGSRRDRRDHRYVGMGGSQNRPEVKW